MHPTCFGLKKFNAGLETWRVQGLLRRDMLAERSLDGLAATLSAAFTARRPCCRLLLGLRANQPRKSSWMLPSVPGSARSARRDNDAGFCPLGGTTRLGGSGGAQSGAKRCQPRGDRQLRSKAERSCGLRKSCQRSTAFSRITGHAACAARASSPQQCNDNAKAAFDVLVQTAFF